MKAPSTSSCKNTFPFSASLALNVSCYKQVLGKPGLLSSPLLLKQSNKKQVYVLFSQLLQQPAGAWSVKHELHLVGFPKKSKHPSSPLRAKYTGPNTGIPAITCFRGLILVLRVKPRGTNSSKENSQDRPSSTSPLPQSCSCFGN